MTELLAIAADNLKDTCESIVKMAGDPRHFNQNSREMQDAMDDFKNRLTLCFTIKNAAHDVARLPKQP